jgi:hypothetical protein
MRRDEVEWVRDNLAAAVETLVGRGDPKPRLERARGKLKWMTRQYMPTKGATQVLTQMQGHLSLLEDTPPAKAGDLVRLRASVGELLVLIDDHLRHWRG